MPVASGRDSKGTFYRYGKSGKKYYYKSEASRKKAKKQAMIQAYAIEKSQERSGRTPDTKKRSRSKSMRKRSTASRKSSGSKRSSDSKRSSVSKKSGSKRTSRSKRATSKGRR